MRLPVIEAVSQIVTLLQQFSPREVVWVLTQVRSHLVQKPVQNGVQGRFTEPVQVVQNEPVHEPGSNGHFAQEILTNFFSGFWSAYPRKVGKQDALRIYRRLKPNQELQDRILRALLEQKSSEQWTSENGRFIPLPKTWLNRGSWDDEPVVHMGVQATTFGRTPRTVFDNFLRRHEP